MNINSNLTVYGSIKSYDDSNVVTADTTFEDGLPLSVNGGAYIGGGLKIGGNGNIYGNLNGNINGNVSGTVTSVTESVGSVTGSVGSVLGNITKVTGNVEGNVEGSVGSVLNGVTGDINGNLNGNLNGNITGSVSSVGVDSMKIYPENTNQINFGGNISSDSIYFGSVAKDRATPTKYYFGAGGQGTTVYAGSVYGAVWNDLADCIEVDFVPKEGYCYCYKDGKYSKGNKGIILGIHSDTYGFALNKKDTDKLLCIGVAGFVLAHTDKIYKSGTPLKANKDGILTKAHFWEINKIVGYFYREEKELEWGDENKKVLVNKRNWIKIK